MLLVDGCPPPVRYAVVPPRASLATAPAVRDSGAALQISNGGAGFWLSSGWWLFLDPKNANCLWLSATCQVRRGASASCARSGTLVRDPRADAAAASGGLKHFYNYFSQFWLRSGWWLSRDLKNATCRWLSATCQVRRGASASFARYGTCSPGF